MGAVKTYPKLRDDELPTVSVIVAARDEKENIQKSLQIQNRVYPLLQQWNQLRRK